MEFMLCLKNDSAIPLGVEEGDVLAVARRIPKGTVLRRRGEDPETGEAANVLCGRRGFVYDMTATEYAALLAEKVYATEEREVGSTDLTGLEGYEKCEMCGVPNTEGEAGVWDVGIVACCGKLLCGPCERSHDCPNPDHPIQAKAKLTHKLALNQSLSPTRAPAEPLSRLPR